MKNIFIACFALLILVFSCARPVPSVQQSTTLPPAAQPAPKAGWEEEWNATLAKAKKEGMVVVYGPPGGDNRVALTEVFMKAYPGIKVEYVGAGGSAHIAKVKAERKAGLFLPDIIVSGTTTILSGFKEFAVPIEPFLILPEVKEGKNWLDGNLHWADRESKFNLVFSTAVQYPMVYNPTLFSSSRVQGMSYWDLAKPEFKEKIIMRDPWTTGPGNITATFFYINSELGRDFVKALMKNDPLISRDDRQVVEWVSTGKRTLGLGPSPNAITELVTRGGMPNVKPIPYLKEGAYTTAAFGSLSVPEGYPHPNTTKIYLNWLLSKEGQLNWSKSTGTPSRRVDVPTDHLDQGILLKPGTKYFISYDEESVDVKAKVMPLILEDIGRP